MKKPVKKPTNINKILIGSLIAIGVVIIILLAAVLFQLKNENSIFFQRNDDKTTSQPTKENNVKKQSTADTANTAEIANDANTAETTADATKNYITVEKALDIALSNIGIKKQNVYDVDVELDHKFGQTVYEVNFNSGKYEYEYYINATSGEIIKSFKEIDF